MKVYLIMTNAFHNNEVAGVFSSEEKAKAWLSDVAFQEYGWTRGEVAMATIEPWVVDET